MNLQTFQLVKRKSDDGNWKVLEDIPDGKEYTVDLDKMLIQEYYSIAKKVYFLSLMVWDTQNEAFFPAELLGIVK